MSAIKDTRNTLNTAHGTQTDLSAMHGTQRLLSVMHGGQYGWCIIGHCLPGEGAKCH